jgi:hypothetical protein
LRAAHSGEHVREQTGETPLPGTEDHDAAIAAGEVFDHDFNAYASTHFVALHPRLNREQLERECRPGPAGKARAAR